MLGQIMNRMADAVRPVFTPLQGQYLAFIHASTLVNGRPPAEHEMMRFFQVTPPTVHRMVLALEQAGLISRQPGTPRSITVLVHEDHLPRLKPGFAQTVKTSVTRY
jgi:DNA-binding MarR family transcriptional regulator